MFIPSTALSVMDARHAAVRAKRERIIKEDKDAQINDGSGYGYI